MKQRYHLLDTVRGIAMVLMLGYHTAWDLIYIFGVNSNLLRTAFGTLWQSASAWTFLILSGFCWSLGRKPLRHGAVCFGFGALMTVITLAIMPENRVVFGVLTLLGSCMMLMVPLDGVFRRIPPQLGMAGAAILFWFTRNLSDGLLGFGTFWSVSVPDWLYQNYLTAYLGFPQRGFYSTDYYPLLPWFFLFCVGYFAYQLAQKYCVEGGRFWRALCHPVPVLEWIGRHSLVLYLFHQPVIYGALYLWFVLLR
ncbi:MAG: heparan-alpha-glucosaminide N-acetyltransferase [Faecalibacterium sp.]